jgi:hypothetical protein
LVPPLRLVDDRAAHSVTDATPSVTDDTHGASSRVV